MKRLALLSILLWSLPVLLATVAPAAETGQATAGASFAVGTAVEVSWGGGWYKAKVIETDATRGWKISYDGYSSNWDEWVGRERLRMPGTPGTAGSSSNASSSSSSSSSSASATGTSGQKTAAPATFAFPERPEGKAAGLEGAYLRVVSWYWNGSLSLTNEGWFFTKNGRFSRTPLGGISLDEFARATTARKQDGVYWFDENKLVLRWASGGKDTEYVFEREKDGVLKIGGVAAVPMQGMPKGWRADVNFEGGASARGGGTFVASSNSLHLRKDGTFGSEAVGSVSAATAAGSVGEGSSSTSAGTYEFDNFLLVLRHADGREERRTVFGFGERDARGAPDYLWREGTMLRRRD